MAVPVNVAVYVLSPPLIAFTTFCAVVALLPVCATGASNRSSLLTRNKRKLSPGFNVPPVMSIDAVAFVPPSDPAVTSIRALARPSNQSVILTPLK